MALSFFPTRAAGPNDENDERSIAMLPHVETNVAACCDKLLAERSNALSMQEVIAALRERTGTDRSDADLAGLIAKKAALFGVAVTSDQH
jgi:hypothetical protein